MAGHNTGICTTSHRGGTTHTICLSNELWCKALYNAYLLYFQDEEQALLAMEAGGSMTQACVIVTN